MTMRGLVLITVCLGNVLAAQAECCKCDCKQSGLQQSQLYYLPIASPSLIASGHGIYQNLGNLQVSDVARSTQAVDNPGYQTSGAAQYSGYQAEIENSLDAGSKVGGFISLAPQKSSQQPLVHYQQQEILHSGSGISIDKLIEQQQGVQKTSEQLSLNYAGQGLSDSAASSGGLGQKQISKVSSDQGSHYIKIEQHVSPQESDSIEEDKGLEHDKDHHHGKNDYYRFEYGVNDQHTHDIKSHKEEKKGDVVQGEYSLVEDSGNVRTVKYYADWKTGFHAQVHNSKVASLS